MIPVNYIEWKECIEHKCGIKLEEDFLRKRIFELKTADNSQTIEFTRLYGKEYLLKVIGWFEQALAGKNSAHNN
jgi:hypothetical protein